MKFLELDLPGVWVIDAVPVTDERGLFRRHYCAREFADHGLAASVAQGNISENPQSGTLRGFHYQLPPHQEAKTLSCLSGAVFDVVVDLRPKSDTFLKWVSVEISAKNRKSLHIPAGCANAWITTEPDTYVHYYMSEFYAPGSEFGIRYDDPFFNFRWPCPPQLMSSKDRSYPDFDRDSFCERQ
jgi:dTDP-4-dehydrorhamnose 3,5-epimerase